MSGGSQYEGGNTQKSGILEKSESLRLSILPTFYVQLLRVQISKAQKDSQLKQLLRFWDLCA